MTTTRPARLRRTSTTLADGRELIYFDDSEPWLSGAATRDAVDHRPLGRARRCRHDAAGPADRRLGGDRRAPAQPHVPAAGGRVPAVPHRAGAPCPRRSRPPTTTSSCSRTASRPSPSQAEAATASGDPLLAERPAHGRCEVVCFTSDHGAAFASLSPSRARTVIDAWADRTAALSAVDEVEQVFCFENRGPGDRGHPAPPARPDLRLPVRPAAHPAAAGAGPGPTTSAPAGCSGADILESERRDGSRVVLSGRHWTAYVPYAARWPVEVHLAPHRDVPDLVALDDEERDELAEVYLDLLRRLDRYYVDDGRRPDRAAVHRRAGTRPRCARAATCPGCTCR